MIDEAFKRLQAQLATAFQAGKSTAELFGMAATFLEAQPKDYADSKRDQLLAEVKVLCKQAPLIDQALKRPEEERAGAILAAFAKFGDMRSDEEKQKQEDEFRAFVAEAQATAEVRRQKHREARLAQGLSAEARTGKPLGQVRLVESEKEEDLPYDDKPRSLRNMIKAVEAAKIVRDQRILDRLPLGASRIGGLPDLPPKVPWPKHHGKKLPLLAQISLSEVPASKRGMLPPDGWLYAFGRLANGPENWPPPVCVMVHRGPREELVRAGRPTNAQVWPDWCDHRVYELIPVAPLGEKQKYRGRGKLRGKGEMAGWLFGKMDDYFGTPGEMANTAMRDGDDWINLLAIKSKGSMEWSDMGHLYLLIRRSDLAKGDFSGVLAAVCSS